MTTGRHPSNREREAAQKPASTAHVDVSTVDGVARWTKALDTTDEALLRAVQVVGTRIDRIKEYLGGGGQAADQADG